MIEGAPWRRWVFFYVPVTAFVVALLCPFYWMVITTIRPDSELYRPWSAANYAPFWTTHPTLEHVHDLLSETLFGTWMLNTMIISLAATAISLFCGLLAGYALSRLKFPFAGAIGTLIFITYLVPQTLLFIPLADIIRNFHLDLSDLFDPVLHVAVDGILQVDSEGTRRVRPHRRRTTLESDGLHHLPGGNPGHPVGRHLRFHPVVERIHLCPGVSVVA